MKRHKKCPDCKDPEKAQNQISEQMCKNFKEGYRHYKICI